MNNPSQKSNGGVGENTEIHQILNLDQPSPFQFVDTTKDNTRTLHLNDLGNSRLIHQAWSPQQPQYNNNANNNPSSPGFFTPGFLESLQEDENESPESFPFHVPPPTRNWSLDESHAKPSMEHETIMVGGRWTPERTLVSQTSEIPLALFHSGPSSPIPSSSSSSSPPPLKHLDDVSLLDHRRTLQAGVINARLLQHAVNAAKMKPLIRHYLLGGGEEKTVVILTSKVAQKSYGTEKRGQEELNPPKLTVNISGETSTPQSGQIEWYTVSGVTVGQTGHIKSQQQPAQNALQQSEHPSRFRSSSESRSNSVDWYHNHQQETLSAGKCVSKHLYINDADEKRKRVECLIKIQMANGIQLGTLASKGIKVISKPSKKRQSVKNMELCIHHGTTVSLFNRIRSQTVSTKYLGVSTAGASFAFPGQVKKEHVPTGEGTCFVARTTCWDPFVIWVVDTTRSPCDAKETDTPEDFIGRNSSFTRNVPYPPPPAIALKNKTGQLIPIHYNQHVVLQCLTTGLVSPVMIIRKVDKASTVVGGAQSTDDLNLVGGGEYGDEVLGDPVSQLHKVALQIVQDPANVNHRQQDYYSRPSPPATTMMPRSSQPVTYLACLNDMVGMHKTTDPRKPIHPPPPVPTATTSTSAMQWDMLDMFDITAQDEKVIRKRRVSGTSTMSDQNMMMMQQRYNPNDEFYPQAMPVTPILSQKFENSRKSSVSSTGSGGRRSSVSNTQSLGAYWSEDVSDAAVWTIVGTDCATYTFSSTAQSEDSHTLHHPFPSLTSFTTKPSKDEDFMLSLHGENFSRDLQVWFGDQKALQTEYRSRELLVCKVPSRHDLLETKNLYNQIPILLVRGDGTICKTNKFYPL
ncbi:hypothetical protein EDC94DRAFT_510969 [Helicostylum pulchrum]|nr:hypothetical protein EDC94DRAFT_510969 [Helicostylum pulchrum]